MKGATRNGWAQSTGDVLPYIRCCCFCNGSEGPERLFACSASPVSVVWEPEAPWSVRKSRGAAPCDAYRTQFIPRHEPFFLKIHPISTSPPPPVCQPSFLLPSHLPIKILLSFLMSLAFMVSWPEVLGSTPSATRFSE
jgi:hypothetical protein